MFLAAITLSAKAVYCESYVKKKTYSLVFIALNSICCLIVALLCSR